MTWKEWLFGTENTMRVSIIERDNNKQKKDNWDAFVYYMMVIATFGAAYLLRLIITTALKKAK